MGKKRLVDNRSALKRSTNAMLVNIDLPIMSSTPTPSIMNIAKQLAEEFWEDDQNYIGSKQFIPNARTTAHDIDAKADRVVFLTTIMSKVTTEMENHGSCGDPYCTHEPWCAKALYFLRQELSRLDVIVDKDPFSSKERDVIYEKLQDVLDELAQIKEGQGIVAQDVEDLKDLLYLGKKNWLKQYTGTVTEWVAAGVIAETTAKPLLEEFRRVVFELPGLPGA